MRRFRFNCPARGIVTRIRPGRKEPRLPSGSHAATVAVCHCALASALKGQRAADRTLRGCDRDSCSNDQERCDDPPPDGAPWTW